ncbi:TetR/AcrR family transcriptional regulator [Yinghuangia sp. ASG 101]|uniref:TetR/AcrR family transcriptional regulator n=1 Tax=Yinghuangia sp. ASG 101 TaxID=2896848 RepID=UPI001E29BB00|nr:TetR/AcrR family transcriptional regulator [Yinghuangia sp. ASG 101]UGQ12066.1 TetR/AcrR family transcriptional regulator [Yinghuangia sp. ASG 101]
MNAHTRGPGAHHDEKRHQIADAVLAIVADQGLAAVSLAETAARAGVSPGRVQHYFPTKQALVEAAFERGNAQSTARIRAKAGGDLDAADPRTVLSAVLGELVPYDDATRAHLRVRQAFTARALPDTRIAERLRAMYADFHRQLANLLTRDLEAGRVRAEVDPAVEASALTALAEGLAYYVLIDVCPSEAARARVQAAVDGLYR